MEEKIYEIIERHRCFWLLIANEHEGAEKIKCLERAEEMLLLKTFLQINYSNEKAGK